MMNRNRLLKLLGELISELPVVAAEVGAIWDKTHHLFPASDSAMSLPPPATGDTVEIKLRTHPLFRATIRHGVHAYAVRHGKDPIRVLAAFDTTVGSAQLLTACTAAAMEMPLAGSPLGSFIARIDEKKAAIVIETVYNSLLPLS